MSTRYLIATAVLFGSACAAHADVLPAAAAPAATTTQSGYLSGWTSGNGTDVVSSGVLGSGSSLIGGVAYGNSTLAQALYEKASANTASGQISVQQGIDGSYLVGMSNAKIAALLGNSVSVVGSGDNLTVTNGGSGANAGAGGSAGGAVGGSAGGSTGSGGGSTGGSTGGSSGGSTGGGSDTGGGSVGVPGTGALDPIPGGGDTGGGNAGADAPDAPIPSAEVPEPSSIALMLAGILGVASLNRRRSR